MGYRFLAGIVVSAVLTLVIVAPAAAQTTAKAPASGKAWTPPRTPDGKPDLQGIWSNATLTPLERPKNLGAKEFYTDEEFANLAKRVKAGDVGEEAELGAAAENPLRYDLSLYGFDLTKSTFASTKRTSLVVGPEGKVPPMLPEARQRNTQRVAANKGHEFDSYENRPVSERCILRNQSRIPMIPPISQASPATAGLARSFT